MVDLELKIEDLNQNANKSLRSRRKMLKSKHFLNFVFLLLFLSLTFFDLLFLLENRDLVVEKIERVVDIESQGEKIHVLEEIEIDLENEITVPTNVVVVIETKRDTEIPTLNTTIGKDIIFHLEKYLRKMIFRPGKKKRELEEGEVDHHEARGYRQRERDM